MHETRKANGKQSKEPPEATSFIPMKAQPRAKKKTHTKMCSNQGHNTGLRTYERIFDACGGSPITEIAESHKASLTANSNQGGRARTHQAAPSKQRVTKNKEHTVHR